MNSFIKTRILFCRVLFILLLTNSAIIAQDKEQKQIDSLKIAAESKVNDTNKVKALYSLAFLLRNNEPHQALSYGEEAIKLAKKVNWEKGEATGFRHLGVIYMNLGDYPKALECLNHSMKIFEKIHNKLGMARCLKIIGDIYIRLSDIPRAQEYLGKALKIYEEANNKSEIAVLLNSIGSTYSNRSDFMTALEYHEKALKISEEIGDKYVMALNLGNIGQIYEMLCNFPRALENYQKILMIHEELGDKQMIAEDMINIGDIFSDISDDQKALDYYEKSLMISEELGNKSLAAHTMSRIGNIYQNQSDYAKALEYNKKSLIIREELGEKGSIAGTLNSLGGIYFRQSQFPQALENFKKSLELHEEMGDKFGMAYSLDNMGEVYHTISDYPKALDCLNKALILIREVEVPDLQCDILRNISVTYEKMGQSKKALEYYKMYFALRDSIVNEKDIKKTVQIQMQYEFDKKEALAKAEQDKKDALALRKLQKRELLNYVFIGGIVLLLLLFFLLYRVYRARQKLRLHDIRNKIAGDLHDDIGSTLNSISVYSELAMDSEKERVEALEMIGEASRKIMEAMGDIVWTINAENDSFEKIIFRMKSLAYNLFRARNIEYTFHADESLDEKKLSLEDRRNFYLIFKEAVTNLVKYANATRAEITLTGERKQIRFCVRDNGVGFDPSRENAGNGLKNMRRRAKEMKAELQIESTIGIGTTIELVLKA